MTFAQTYLSRKQLLVDKLASKGVTGYSSSDGLTTLISAVEEIESGSGKILKLFSDKTVLSKYDSDVATLTAILLDNEEGVAGEEIEFEFGNGLGVYVDTNEQGVASTTYTSQGLGDLTMSITADNMESELAIEDCIYAKLSEYTLTRSSSSEVCTLIDSNLRLTLPINFSFEYDYKGALNNARFGLFDSQYYNSNRNYSLTTQLGATDYTGVYRDTSTHGLDSGKLYTDTTQYNSCKITITNGTVTWLLGGTNSASVNLDWITSHNPYVIGTQTWSTGTIYVKNLKLKPL